MSKGKKEQKWYYDACALDNDRNTYREIFNGSKNKIDSLASNLSIGEAYGNSYRKKGKDAAESFVNLIKTLNKLGTFKIINHIGIDKIFSEIRLRQKFQGLSIPDAIHLATAIKNSCCNLRTVDSDLYNLSKKEVKELSTKFNNPNFAITRMN